MQYYFAIQHKRLQRWLTDLGMNPYVGYITGFLVFVLLSTFLFYKTVHASWIYVLIAVFTIFNLNESARNMWLKSIFSSHDYPLIRIIENCLTALPFCVYLLCHLKILQATITFLLAVVITFIPSYKFWHKIMSTPFRRLPFEFIIGFRKSFWLIAIVYFLVFKAIQVDNYNLGLVGMVLIFFIAMFYYQKPEPEYFVWIFTVGTNKFLKSKLLTCIVCLSILSFGAVIALLIAFSEYWLSTTVVYLAAYILPSSMIVAKYATYPYEMNIPQGILYAISLMFPPLLLFTLWIFYKQSRRRLDPILEC